MAHLPPKVPNVMHQDSHHQQWQEFLHPQHHNQPSQNPPWIDEFIEFTTAKRGAHRRAVSDSVAFVEAGPVPFLGRPPDITERDINSNENDFDKFDDEQFMSMFSNDLGRSSSNLSSTSDHNSTNDDQKRLMTARGEELRCSERVDDGEKVEEVESLRKFDKDQGQVQPQGGGERSPNKGGNIAATNNGDVHQQEQQPTVDPKRVKRILANRQSAQRSRVRKLQYISELERSVTALQSEVSALSPSVAFLDHQRMILNVDNSTLKAKIAALAQDKIFKDAHQEAMKREIERLRQVYYQQNLDNTTDSMIPPPSSSSLPPTSHPPPSDATMHEDEHLNV